MSSIKFLYDDNEDGKYSRSRELGIKYILVLVAGVVPVIPSTRGYDVCKVGVGVHDP